ncbi:hypothetical protein GEMRC1_010042 [Eukaryota sp. GEM-RC1]
MSGIRKGSDASHATTAMVYNTHSVGQKVEHRMFSLFQLSIGGNVRSPNRRICSQQAKLSQLGLTFDGRLLYYLTIPLTSKELDISPWTMFASTMTFLGLICLGLCVYFVFGDDHIESSSLLPVIKASTHVLVCFLYFPILTILLSFLSCGSDDTSFLTLFPPDDCWHWHSILVRSILFLLTIVFVVIVLYCSICAYDCNPCSKRIFARSNSTCQFWFFIAQTVLPIVFYLFPHRKWLFRSLYIFFSLLVPFLFITRLPFYKSLSNIKFVLFLSVWTGTALTYFANLIYLHTIESANVQAATITSTSIITQTLLKNFKTTFQNVPFSVVLDSQEETEDPPSVNIPIPKQLPVNPSVIKRSWQVELATRFLQPKPSKASEEDKEAAFSIYSRWSEPFTEDIDLILSKTAFQLFVRENHMAMVGLTTTVNTMDIDLSFRHRCLLVYYQRAVKV